MNTSIICHSLAVVQNDGAVGPAVMIHQTEVWKETDPHGLKTSLITQRKAITVNLREREREMRVSRANQKTAAGFKTTPTTPNT